MSPLRKRKISKLFQVTDVDGNGIIEFADYQRMLANLGRRRGWDFDHPNIRRLLSLLRHSWTTLCHSVDENDDEQVTQEEWFEIWERFYEVVNYKPGQTPSWFAASAQHFFETLDLDGDGKVSPGDYAGFLQANNINEDPEPLFAKLDLNGDGYVTQSEGILLATQFYLGDDENEPGTWLYGQLPA